MRARRANRIGIKTTFLPDQTGKKPNWQTVPSSLLLYNGAEAGRGMGAPRRDEGRSQKNHAGDGDQIALPTISFDKKLKGHG